MIVKHKLAALVAVLALAAGAAVAVAALASRDENRDAPSAVAEMTPTPSASPTSASKPGKKGKPGKVVDPTTGRSFCRTVKLLGAYSAGDYGLRADGSVDGKAFDRRLETTAKTYSLLATQAKAEPAAAAGSDSWAALAQATAHGEDTFRAVGLDVHSQSFIVEMAQVADLHRRAIPKATAGLKAACGFTGESVGIKLIG